MTSVESLSQELSIDLNSTSPCSLNLFSFDALDCRGDGLADLKFGMSLGQRPPVLSLDLAEHSLNWVQHWRVLDIEEHCHLVSHSCLKYLFMLVDDRIVHEHHDALISSLRMGSELGQCLIEEVVKEHGVHASFNKLC